MHVNMHFKVLKSHISIRILKKDYQHFLLLQITYIYATTI